MAALGSEDRKAYAAVDAKDGGDDTQSLLGRKCDGLVVEDMSLKEYEDMRRRLAPHTNAVRMSVAMFMGFEDMVMEKRFRVQSDAFDSMLRRINAQVAFLISAMSILQIIYLEVCFVDDTLFFESVSECVTSQVMLGVIWALYLIIAQRLWSYYTIMAEKKQWQWMLESAKDSFWNSSLKWKFLVELIIMVVIPWPGMGAYNRFIFGHKQIVVALFLRMYIYVRMFRDYSMMYRRRHLIRKGTKFDTPEYRFDMTTVLKTYFYTHTISMVSAAFAASVLLSSYVIYVLEREYWWPYNDRDPHFSGRDYKNFQANISDYYHSPFALYGECIWFVCVTMTTLGYGDITPYTWQAKIYTIITCLAGLIITSVLVGVITNKLVPTAFQQVVIAYFRLNKLRSQKRDFAARIIQTTWREYKRQGSKIPLKQRLLVATRPWVKRLRKTNRFEQDLMEEVSDFISDGAIFCDLSEGDRPFGEQRHTWADVARKSQSALHHNQSLGRRSSAANGQIFGAYSGMRGQFARQMPVTGPGYSKKQYQKPRIRSGSSYRFRGVSRVNTLSSKLLRKSPNQEEASEQPKLNITVSAPSAGVEDTEEEVTASDEDEVVYAPSPTDNDDGKVTRRQVPVDLPEIRLEEVQQEDGTRARNASVDAGQLMGLFQTILANQQAQQKQLDALTAQLASMNDTS